MPFLIKRKLSDENEVMNMLDAEENSNKNNILQNNENVLESIETRSRGDPHAQHNINCNTTLAHQTKTKDTKNPPQKKHKVSKGIMDETDEPYCCDLDEICDKPGNKANCRLLPKEAVTILKEWIFAPEHFNFPYPTDQEKQELMVKTGINSKQIKYWFINARRRIWREKYLEKNRSAKNAKKKAKLLASSAASKEKKCFKKESFIEISKMEQKRTLINRDSLLCSDKIMPFSLKVLSHPSLNTRMCLTAKLSSIHSNQSRISHNQIMTNASRGLGLGSFSRTNVFNPLISSSPNLNAFLNDSFVSKTKSFGA